MRNLFESEEFWSRLIDNKLSSTLNKIYDNKIPSKVENCDVYAENSHFYRSKCRLDQESKTQEAPWYQQVLPEEQSDQEGAESAVTNREKRC